MSIYVPQTTQPLLSSNTIPRLAEAPLASSVLPIQSSTALVLESKQNIFTTSIAVQPTYVSRFPTSLGGATFASFHIPTSRVETVAIPTSATKQSTFITQTREVQAISFPTSISQPNSDATPTPLASGVTDNNPPSVQAGKIAVVVIAILTVTFIFGTYMWMLWSDKREAIKRKRQSVTFSILERCRNSIYGERPEQMGGSGQGGEDAVPSVSTTSVTKERVRVLA